MRESCTSGSARGASSNGGPYRNRGASGCGCDACNSSTCRSSASGSEPAGYSSTALSASARCGHGTRLSVTPWPLADPFAEPLRRSGITGAGARGQRWWRRVAISIAGTRPDGIDDGLYRDTIRKIAHKPLRTAKAKTSINLFNVPLK